MLSFPTPRLLTPPFQTKVRRITHGLAALQDMAKDMDGNLESMPSPAIKAFHLAYNTRRASSKFLGKLKGNRVFPSNDDDVQVGRGLRVHDTTSQTPSAVKLWDRASVGTATRQCEPRATTPTSPEPRPR